MGVWSAEGGMADLDRSQGTGLRVGGLRTPFSEQRPETERYWVEHSQPPRSPTYTARGDVCPPFASTSCFSSWFRFSSPLPSCSSLDLERRSPRLCRLAGALGIRKKMLVTGWPGSRNQNQVVPVLRFLRWPAMPCLSFSGQSSLALFLGRI